MMGATFTCSSEEFVGGICPITTGEQVLDNYYMTSTGFAAAGPGLQILWNCIVLFGMIIVFKTIAYFGLLVFKKPRGG